MHTNIHINIHTYIHPYQHAKSIDVHNSQIVPVFCICGLHLGSSSLKLIPPVTVKGLTSSNPTSCNLARDKKKQRQKKERARSKEQLDRLCLCVYVEDLEGKMDRERYEMQNRDCLLRQLWTRHSHNVWMYAVIRVVEAYDTFVMSFGMSMATGWFVRAEQKVSRFVTL